MTAPGWPEIKAVLGDVLEADPGDRPAVLERLCGTDSALRGAVESLLALETRADAALESRALPGAALRTQPETQPEMIGPYRILREIGRGGMGVVYLGERADGQYRKQVAIKVITSGWRDPGLERRFQRERQILAQLEHPAIARFLDGGATGDGRPYFVMEYIEGRPLLAWCEEQRLAIPARLQLFLQICDAVSYAHQRLVVHRDLKPGNVLVRPEGSAKLLDFGLARVLSVTGEAGQDLTLTGMPLMTPAYASPEQVRGELYTVAGDVYSLGVILYEILTGQRPYELPTTSYLEMARIICEQEPAPLSHAVADERLRRALKGDLEKIAGKAMAKDASRRYATADDFAADIRRHLEGRPVQARPATFAYRAGKLLRRHRVAISAGSLALVLILAFAGAAAWEARRAQRRFQDVRHLAHSVIFELHDAIQKLPGSTAARELLVRRALEYLENLSREASRDPALQREIALAYEKIADVQGNLGESNLGRVSAALESYRKAEAILSGLVDRSPADALLRRQYLHATHGLVSLYGELGQYENGTRLARRSIALAASAVRAQPADPPALADLAAGLGQLASLLSEQQDYQGAISLRERVLELTRRVRESQPGSESSRYNLAVAYKRLGALYGMTKRYDEARRQYEQARASDEAYALTHPTDFNAKLDLSYDYSDLAWVASRTGEYAGALASHRRVLALRQEAASADPNNYRARVGIASTVDRIGGVLRQMGDFPAAIAQSRRAIPLYEALASASGARWRDWTGLAEAHTNLGDTYIAMAEQKNATPPQHSAAWSRAAAEYEQAREIFLDQQKKGALPPEEIKRLGEISAEAARCRAARDQGSR
jgi:eukaryotic-like serine/threonine-protein kinase